MKTILTIFVLALTGILPTFAADPTTAPAAPYPLKTCVVSGRPLGEMGEPYVFTYQGTQVELCCPHCKPEFDMDPAKYIKKIQDAPKAP